MNTFNIQINLIIRLLISANVTIVLFQLDCNCLRHSQRTNEDGTFVTRRY